MPPTTTPPENGKGAPQGSPRGTPSQQERHAAAYRDAANGTPSDDHSDRPRTRPGESSPPEKSLKSSRAENFLSNEAGITLDNFSKKFNVGTVVQFLKQSDPSNPDLAALEDAQSTLAGLGALNVLNELNQTDFDAKLKKAFDDRKQPLDAATQTKLQQAWQKYQGHQKYFYQILVTQKEFTDAIQRQKEALGGVDSNSLEKTAKMAMKNFKSMPLVLKAAVIVGIGYLASLLVNAEEGSTMDKVKKTLLWTVGGSLLGAAVYQMSTGKSAYKELQAALAPTGMPEYWQKAYSRSKVEDTMVMRDSTLYMGSQNFGVLWDKYLDAKKHGKDEIPDTVNHRDMSPKDVFTACKVFDEQYGSLEVDGHKVEVKDMYKNRPSLTWRDVVFDRMANDKRLPEMSGDGILASMAKAGYEAVSNPGKLYRDAKGVLHTTYAAGRVLVKDAYGAGKGLVGDTYDAVGGVSGDLLHGGKVALRDTAYGVGGALADFGSGAADAYNQAHDYLEAKYGEIGAIFPSDVAKYKIIQDSFFENFIKGEWQDKDTVDGFLLAKASAPDSNFPGVRCAEIRSPINPDDQAIYIIAQKQSGTLKTKQQFSQGVNDAAKLGMSFLKAKYPKDPDVQNYPEKFAVVKSKVYVDDNGTALIRMPLPGSAEFRKRKVQVDSSQSRNKLATENQEMFGNKRIDYGAMSPLDKKKFRLHFLVDSSQETTEIKTICDYLTSKYRGISPPLTLEAANKRPLEGKRDGDDSDFNEVNKNNNIGPLKLKSNEGYLRGLESRISGFEKDIARASTNDNDSYAARLVEIEIRSGLDIRLGILGDTAAKVKIGADYKKDPSDQKNHDDFLQWYENALKNKYPPLKKP